MNPNTRDFLDNLPTLNALWWFIENVEQDDPDRTELFFYLRERVRAHNTGNKHENETNPSQNP